jgi:hypothetical protein
LILPNPAQAFVAFDDWGMLYDGGFSGRLPLKHQVCGIRAGGRERYGATEDWQPDRI